jgi:alkaline phosphatase D
MSAKQLILGPIIGGLSHNRAHLWGRSAATGVLHAWLGKQPDLSDATLAGVSLPLRPESGWAGVAPVRNLSPNTRYYYALTFYDSPPEVKSGYSSFVTFPLPGEPVPFNFVFGSCFCPRRADSGQIFSEIDRVRRSDNLHFALMIGDQIYADEGEANSLRRVAVTLSDYRQVYQYVWGFAPLRGLLADLPAFMTLDDHEVDDDWRWTNHARTRATIPVWDQLKRLAQGRPVEERTLTAARVRDALQAYWEHQGMHAPPYCQAPQINSADQYTLAPDDPGSLAYTFEYGAAAFFVLDTRSRRVVSRTGNSMLSAGQWQALGAWLTEVKDRYPLKFIVTSGALLFDLWLDIPRDRWSGFPEERNRLLSILATEGIEGVHFLAGDLHSAHAVRAELYGPQGRGIPVREFCSSPFEQTPSRYSRALYTPVRAAPVKNQQCEFIVSAWNFGLVRVSYPQVAEPQVVFELYGEQGDLLAKSGPDEGAVNPA